MTATRIALTATLLAAGLAGTALAQSPAHHHGGTTTGDAPSTRDFEEADRAMMRAMHVAYTGNPDIDFRTHMIPHHQGAIDMARVALKHAKDAQTRAMAQKIIDDQEKEIAEMRAWLKRNGR
ncbi:CopM family metallochaperone [Methylobacterium sp. ID0610]|uniref:CopM family metallochaperone n=1 Tax=Methylobacterium carpenticola TaxID=3344827 RepID=UPI0036C7F69B